MVQNEPNVDLHSFCSRRQQQTTRFQGKVEVTLTGVGGRALGSAGEVAGALSLALALEVAVDRVGAVSPHCVWLEARTARVDRLAVSPSPARIVQSLLQHQVRQPFPASTPSSTTCKGAQTDVYVRRHSNMQCLLAEKLDLITYWNGGLR